jgi:hypothetical protein
MNWKRLCLILALCALLAALAVGGAALWRAAPAAAQTSAHYNLEWHVIGGGGQPVASTHYAVNSTAGQGAASPPYSASAHYIVSGGYWYGGRPAPIRQIYLPVVVREH